MKINENKKVEMNVSVDSFFNQSKSFNVKGLRFINFYAILFLLWLFYALFSSLIGTSCKSLPCTKIIFCCSYFMHYFLVLQVLGANPYLVNGKSNGHKVCPISLPLPNPFLHKGDNQGAFFRTIVFGVQKNYFLWVQWKCIQKSGPRKGDYNSTFSFFVRDYYFLLDESIQQTDTYQICSSNICFF